MLQTLGTARTDADTEQGRGAAAPITSRAQLVAAALAQLEAWHADLAEKGVVHDMYDTGALGLLHYALRTDGDDGLASETVTADEKENLPLCSMIERKEIESQKSGGLGPAAVDIGGSIAPATEAEQQRAINLVVDMIYEGRWKLLQGHASWDSEPTIYKDVLKPGCAPPSAPSHLPTD
eukprot:5660223-Prymnesium_polylepis.1